MDVNNIKYLGVIYQITNLRNGKKYVGQTRQTLSDRLGQHRTDTRGYPISRAIRKYGWESFEVVVLAESKSQERLDQLEEYFIIVSNSQKPVGYNIKSGGNNSSVSEETRSKLRKAQLGKRLSSEIKKKMSMAHRGKPKHWASMKGKKHSEKTKSILSQQKVGKNNPFFGRKHTEETKKKISERSKKPRKRQGLQSPQE